MKIRTFTAEQWLPSPPGAVFPFFADAANLEVITPPWLNFRILTPGPIDLKPGALIDYRLRIRGVPIRWRTRIASFDPPHGFVDEQLKGPYRLWRHVHTFEPETRGGVAGSRCLDRVEYAVPFDALVHSALVRPDIVRIFAFRRDALARRFHARAT